MIEILVFILLHFVFFIPLYLIWRSDCKNIGKENLAVSLHERFLYFSLFCPIWIFGILEYLK